jgi:hypothetical protein
MDLELLGRVTRQVERFESAAHAAMSQHEAAATSRVMSLDASRRKLQGLSLQQHELLMEALECVERGLYRAAHVSAWQALIDFLSEKLASDGFNNVGQARPKWPKFGSVEELREFANEHEQIVVAREVKLLSKAEAKILHGMLSKRNECAHPGHYRPDLNESLGYVSEVINRIASLQPKTL